MAKPQRKTLSPLIRDGRILSASERAATAQRSTAFSTEHIPMQTLLPQQRVDHEESTTHIPKVFKEDFDDAKRWSWKPEDQTAGTLVPLAPASVPHQLLAAPKEVWQYGVVSRNTAPYTYESAQAIVARRHVTLPAHVAIARAQAIEAGTLRGDSTLYEHLSGVIKKPSHRELVGRRRIASGALAAIEAPVERRKSNGMTIAADRRNVASMPTVLEEIVPDDSTLSDGIKLAKALGNDARVTRVNRPPRARKRVSWHTEDHLPAGVEPLMHGGLGPPSATGSVDSRGSLWPAPLRTKSATALARARRSPSPSVVNGQLYPRGASPDSDSTFKPDYLITRPLSCGPVMESSAQVDDGTAAISRPAKRALERPVSCSALLQSSTHSGDPAPATSPRVFRSRLPVRSPPPIMVEVRSRIPMRRGSSLASSSLARPSRISVRKSVGPAARARAGDASGRPTTPAPNRQPSAVSRLSVESFATAKSGGEVAVGSRSPPTLPPVNIPALLAVPAMESRFDSRNPNTPVGDEGKAGEAVDPIVLASKVEEAMPVERGVATPQPALLRGDGDVAGRSLPCLAEPTLKPEPVLPRGSGNGAETASVRTRRSVRSVRSVATVVKAKVSWKAGSVFRGLQSKIRGEQSGST